ncbi:hypothetical protein B0H19DRAFT_186650 [Mycena capillaripes]|nr:hypothetical protein B0H19DRAFT_186650 [Mycena capillaripes]
MGVASRLPALFTVQLIFSKRTSLNSRPGCPNIMGAGLRKPGGKGQCCHLTVRPYWLISNADKRGFTAGVSDYGTGDTQNAAVGMDTDSHWEFQYP